MNIALAQINYHIGNFTSNEQKVIAAIEQAKIAGADLVVFAELAISGYPPRDFLEFDDFIDKCLASINNIAKAGKGIGVIIGGPSRNPGKKGKGLFNTAFFIENGKVAARHFKSLLPNYDIFDEYRYFEPGYEFQTIEFMGKKIALTICEDLWNIGNDLLYRHNPMDDLYNQNPDMIINIAASPFHYMQAENRKEGLLNNVNKYKLPLFYVNHVGAQTELIFDGGSLVLNSQGIIVDELAYFQEDLKVYNLEDIERRDESVKERKATKISLIHKALVLGIKNYFRKLGFRKAILGLSGGIDSAVTLVLAAEALGTEHVKAVLLPSQFSSQHSIKDAEDLAKNLGVDYETIPISESYKNLEETLHPQFKNLPFNIAEENIQARIRGLILMALSNKFGYIPNDR